MQTILAANWKPAARKAYIWEETGVGMLRQVTAIRADWWIVTGMCSWCCCPNTVLYVPENDAELAAKLEELQENLKLRRERWEKVAAG